ncbi:hypothetical protein SAMN05444416_10429 [Thermoactinomyces sp. DSM 45892]|nr:hypothetical protein SAMN05444416_10429 [Thermoactinomyces sp. DSM 45892]
MKRGFIFLTGAVVVGSVLVGVVFSNVFSTNSTEANPSKSTETTITKKADEKSPIKTIEPLGDVETIFPDIPSLTKVADVIFEGEVINTKTIYHKDIDIPSTISEVKVIKVNHGSIKAGDVLVFRERGGVTTQKYVKENSGRDFPLSKEEENEPVEFKINGIAVMKKGEKVILFGGKNKDETYSVVGAYQGKFRIDGSTIQRPVPRGDEGIYSSLKMSQSSLENEVNQFKK